MALVAAAPVCLCIISFIFLLCLVLIYKSVVGFFLVGFGIFASCYVLFVCLLLFVCLFWGIVIVGIVGVRLCCLVFS